MSDGFIEFEGQMNQEERALRADFQLYAAASYALDTTLKLVHGGAIIETITLLPDLDHSRNKTIIKYPLGKLTFRKQQLGQDPISQNELYCTRDEIQFIKQNLAGLIRKIESENSAVQIQSDECILAVTGTDYFNKLADAFGPLAPALKIYRTGNEESRAWLEAIEN